MTISLGPNGLVLGSDTFANKYDIGKLIQVQRATVGNTVINSSSWTTLVEKAITIQQGSHVYVSFQAEQNAEGGAAWQWQQLWRDNTQLGTSIITVATEGWNDSIHLSYWDYNMNAGTYTYKFRAYNGSNYCRYGEHSSPRIDIVEFGG